MHDGDFFLWRDNVATQGISPYRAIATNRTPRPMPRPCTVES